MFISPVLPHYGDSPAALVAVMKRAAEAGVSRIGVDRLNLYPAAVAGLARVSCPKAVQALRAYKASPQNYLTHLRSAVLERAAGADIGIPVQVSFDADARGGDECPASARLRSCPDPDTRERV